ncbi:MAG: AIPR family protein [Zhenhengia sp.]
MRDVVVKSYFNKFLKEYSITGRNIESNFEKFINHICLVSKNISNFNLYSMSVGNGDDAGIDGIGISINNRFINDITELKAILGMQMHFSLEFYFIQAKTTEGFECKEIASFGEGVVDMFREEHEIKKKMNTQVKDKYKLIREILDNYEYIKSKKCVLYYVTPGEYVEDDNLRACIERIKEDVLRLGIFDEKEISVEIKGKTFIRKQYEQTKLQNSAQFKLDSKIDIPYTEKVDEAYFAIMPIKEYLRIVLDEDGKVRRGIFELNVRDFAGIEDNRVNQGMISTLTSNDKSTFGLLNNGITIVGKSLNKVQGQYSIKNFYVVNGCQTTNVLYENIECLDDNMWISLKIVITQDDEIIKNIVKATNSQTEVQEIQLISMDEYQSELEGYFNHCEEKTKLFYERRDGQYRGLSGIEITKIVNAETQMKSFASIFLEVPHIASRYVGKLQEEVSKKIFVKGHRVIMYYAAALLNYKLEAAFLNDIIEHKYNKFKYHMELIIAKLIWKEEKKPQFNSYSMDVYCRKLIDTIENGESFNNLLQEAKNILDIVVGNVNDTEANKLNSLVNELLLYCNMGITRAEISEMIYFINNIYAYEIPFKNMSIDGDLRYNFNKNLNDLIWMVNKRGVKKYMKNNQVLEEIREKVDETNRQSRIIYS